MPSAWDVQLQSLQAQVGTIDALETLSAAYSPDGWLGGLDGVGRILASYPDASLEPLEQLRHPGRLDLSPVTCSVATSEGLRRCVIEDAEYAFGGDARTQLIGLTICALAHECEGQNAVELFIDAFGSCIFHDLDDVKLAIYSQLVQNYVRILNEGAARGFTERFISTIAELNILSGDRAWLRKNLLSPPNGLFQSSEAAMLGGLLNWMAQHRKGPYPTRSGLVVRAAACLKEVGYRIGEIQVWMGAGDGDLPPKENDLIPVVLVLGDSAPLDPVSFPVDPLALKAEDIVARSYTLHYDYNTVGSMLLAALNNQSDVKADVYQAQFEQIYDYFESNLSVEWELSKNPLTPLQARASWNGSLLVDDKDIEIDIAEFYFPRSAEHISHLYRRIATQEALDEITKNFSNFGCFDECFPESLAMFRAITAAIAISFASRLTPRNFKTTRHCASLELDNGVWLEHICEVADKVMSDIEPEPLQFEQAIFAVATIHTAADPECIRKADYQLIGWRNGIYAIVPPLLVDMAPVSEAVGIQCLDNFLANVMVNSDDSGTGAIQGSVTPLSCAKHEAEEEGEGTGNDSNSPSTIDPNIGPAIPGSPDVPISLSFGPPTHLNGSHLCLRASIQGSIVETVGIKGVLNLLAASQGEPSECSHQEPSNTQVFNLKPSIWVARKRVKPVHPKHATFIPVQGDRAWTIFLAGEVWWYNGYIVYRCVDCALEHHRRTKANTTDEEDTDGIDVDNSSESGTDVSWRTLSSEDDEEDTGHSDRTVLIGYHHLLDT